jgi:hypothetical protein
MDGSIHMIKFNPPHQWKGQFSRFGIESGVFLLLLMSFILKGAKELTGQAYVYYAMDYSLGLGPRLLIGSILKLFYADYLNSWLVHSFVFVSIVVMLSLVAVLIGFCIRNAPSDTAKHGITLLSILYLACPASPGYLWSPLNMGRLDLYLLLLTMLTCFVFLKLSSFTLQCVCYGFIGILCIAIFPIYVFIFFPLTLVMIADKLFNSGWKLKNVAAGAGAIAAVCGAFIFFQFFSHINVTTVEELHALLSSKTNVFIHKEYLSYQYFADMPKHIDWILHSAMIPPLQTRLMSFAISLILLSPLFAVYGYLWGKAYRLSSEKRFGSKYLWMVLIMLSFLPAFFVAADWGRWLAAFFTVQFLVMVVLLQKGDPYLSSATGYLVNYFKQRKFFFILFVLYLAMLEKLSIFETMPDAFDLHRNILIIIEFIRR